MKKLTSTSSMRISAVAVAFIAIVLNASIMNESADLVFINGKIITVDEDDHIVQAVAVKDSLIYAVGTTTEIMTLVGDSTEVRNLKGKCMTPGIIDAHTHLMYYGQGEIDYVNLRPPEVQTVEDLVAKIEERVKSIEPGEWVIGDGYFKLEKMPTRYDLDPVSPDNPVFLNSLGGHYGTANSKALEIACIDSTTEDPVGGIIQRDSTGVPNGLFWNHPAMDMVRQYIPPLDETVLTECVLYAQEKYLNYGITSFQDVNCRGISRLMGYVHAVDSLKIRGYLSFTIEKSRDAAFSIENLQPYQGPWLSLMSDKFLLDGQPPTSFTYDPHLGPTHDLPTWNPDTLKKVVKDLHCAGHQIAIHVMGDAAIDLALDAIEEALNDTPKPDHRHRLEHVMIPTEEAIQRMAQLGVIASLQPAAIYASGDFYTKIWGAETARRLKPLRSLLDAGIHIALGTDYPTVPRLHPKYTLWACLARRTSSGITIAPEESITIQEALRAHTMGSAYAAFEEDVKGSIEVGKYADMTIWSDDLYSVPVSEIPNLWIRGVVVGGTVYDNVNASVEDNRKANLPENIQLYYNYPNPFNPSTNIVYNLVKPGHTSLKIYNAVGQCVRTLVNHIQLPGKYIVTWDSLDNDGKNVPSGQYYFQLAQGDHIIIKKALLLK
ncbi:amidohydrolase family protein [bacterium]|nr:amidohydrolase family protein [bacterium]